MTVFELIKKLVDYPADAEVYAKIDTMTFDVDDVDSEYHGYPLPKDNRAVIVLSV
jgi:hypothetical protein